jgi:hypothetical protein
MKAIIEILDSQFDKLIKQSIDNALVSIDLEKLIETKVNSRVDIILRKNISDEKIESFTRDRVSRIITTESLKDFTYGINGQDVLSNLESKILLMIQNSKDFKILVRQTIKNSL